MARCASHEPAPCLIFGVGAYPCAGVRRRWPPAGLARVLSSQLVHAVISHMHILLDKNIPGETDLNTLDAEQATATVESLNGM